MKPSRDIFLMPARARRRARYGVTLRKAVLAIGVSLAVSVHIHAGDSRFRFAATDQWSQKRGFYLNLENKTKGKAVCGLDTLRLILGVGDGQVWRFLSAQPKWQTAHDYVVRAVVLPDRSELWLDGKKVAESLGRFVPGSTRLTAGDVPGWASSPTNYLVLQKELHIRTATGRKRDVIFPDRASLPMGLLLFQPQVRQVIKWDAGGGEPFLLQATFRILIRPPLKELAPFIDEFGQCRFADWAEKVESEADLRADASSEDAQLVEMPPSSDFDPYGGWKRARWRGDASGFFSVVRHKQFWWLVSPLGYPCFYLGVDSIPSSTWPQTPVGGREYLFKWLPPKTGVWQAAWGRNQWGRRDGDYVCFQACNLIRKYGDDWQDRASTQGVRRVRGWGFSGGGKWGAPKGIVSTPVLSLKGVPKLAGHPDVFDATVRKRIRESLAAQIGSRKKDHFVLGWSIGNEYNEIITAKEIREILGQTRLSPGRRALVGFAFEKIYGRNVRAMAAAWHLKATEQSGLYIFPPKPPDADVEKMRRFYADRYYKTLYDTVKSIDPSHLYLGFWIGFGWWENEEDWRMIARHCDIIGYDRYTLEFDDADFQRLAKEADKPLLWGEFSVPPTYGGRRGFGQYAVSVESEVEAGRVYERLIRQAATSPWCVGAMWFQYRDQPLTGRGPGHGPRLVFGEHYAFGLVTTTDRVKWPLVKSMRRTNLKAVAWRAGATARSLP